MSEHEKEIEDFGQNDDFWLFGYGYVTIYSDHYQSSLTWAQELDMETAATLW
jgi:hypothetical protein